MNTYIVKENDNLYDIAKKYNTTVSVLKALNNLQSNILQIGQELKLPTTASELASPSDYLIYTIKPGDTLYNIAKNYNITLEELINFNEQDSTLLKIGEQLLIPIADNDNEMENENNNLIYVVKPGDTLYNIAKRYNTNVDLLKSLNKLNSNLLKIGETLIIPETYNYQTYVVKDNDTLESIADFFDIDIADIKKINNMETDDILVGQILLIPKTKD